MANSTEDKQQGSISYNQKGYDVPNKVDHQIDVLDIYFAEQQKKYKWIAKEETYIVKNGGTIADIKTKYNTQFKTNKKIVRNVNTDPDHTNALKKGDTVKITWEEREDDGVVFEKLKTAILGRNVFVVAKCNVSSGGKLTVEIHENKLTNNEAIYDAAVKFLIGKEEKQKIEFTLSKDKAEYTQEITLRPKEDKDFLALMEKYEKRENKKANVYIKAEVTGTSDEIKFPNSNKEFLNEDQNRFEILYCNCGEKYRPKVKCTRYNSVYGPIYKGVLPLNDFTKWDDLTKNNQVSADEKTILIAMSENEGNMDAVQSYDSEIITAGAMQKTINPQGQGELSKQFWEFKESYPEKYKSLLEHCKWEVKKEEIVDAKGKTTGYKYVAYYDNATGSALKTKIRDGFAKSNYGDAVECRPMEPIINLMNDIDFQTKQITDFIARMNSALAKTPTGYSNSISTYVKSNLGKATVLDQDVNRPGHVKDCFGDALDSFFKSNPKVDKDPSKWGADFGKNEKAILEIYGPLRSSGNYTMTDGQGRYDKLKAKL